MALKVLLLRSRLAPLQTELQTLETTRDGFAAREAELEHDIAEAQTDEERSVVEAAVNAFEQERSANAADITRVQERINEINEEIRSLEAAQTPPAADPPAAEPTGTTNTERSNYSMPINNPERRWFGLTYQERDALLTRDSTKEFLQRVRQLRAQQNSVTGAELGIPTEFMQILRDLTYQNSKLWPYVHSEAIRGKARQNVAGTGCEAVWSEMLANINEIVMDFTQLEMDGYMLAGYIAISNAVLEDDSDLQLLTSILNAMGEANARGLDKAIVYGTGKKMPVGFITRLAASAQPEWWNNDQGDFKDLHSSHILKLDIDSTSGAAFFGTLIEALGIADPKYSDGRVFWVMNRKTHIRLMSKALAFDSAAAITAGINNTFPIVGGDIIELDFMADNDIAGGFGSLMRMSEREGASIASSDIPFFLRNMTVYRSIGRYDGKPARGEAFVLVNFHNTAPTTSISFAPNLANDPLGTLIVTTAAGTGASGDSTVTVAGNGSGTLKYQVGGQAVPVANGETVDKSWTDLPANKTIKSATTGATITVVEVNADGKAVAVGSGSVTAKA
jgi:HK97 family phage major capsid protein|nr:MAG TPA: major capsid protein [Caudoviricetes sp.]